MSSVSKPEWLTDKLIAALYRAEAEWISAYFRPPEEIGFHPDDVPGGELQLMGYRVVLDNKVPRGTFVLRRVRTIRIVTYELAKAFA